MGHATIDDPYKCCGCGKVAQGYVKPCDCPTMVGYRNGDTKTIIFTLPWALRVCWLWEDLRSILGRRDRG